MAISWYLGIIGILGILISLQVVFDMAPSQGSRSRYNACKRHARVNNNYKHKLREKVGVIGSKTNLKTSMLNVDGLSDTSLADVQDFVAQSSPDVVFLLETKRRFEEFGTDIAIDGYEHFEVKRSDVADHKQGGGLVCYTRRTDGLVFKRHTPEIMNIDLEYVNYERIWITIDSLKSKTAILGVYMGCQYEDDRHADWNEGIYQVLTQEATKLRSEGYRIIFIGDFNGHVGCVPGQGVPGNNPDINPNGRRFLNFLERCDLRHVNGECRIAGRNDICQGTWTRQRGRSRSVIDFAGVSSEHINHVVSMVVDEQGLDGGNSDHNWITLTLEDKFKRLHLMNTQRKKEKWNIKEDQDWSIFQTTVASELPSLPDALNMNVNELATAISSALYAAGVSTIGFRSTRPKLSMWSRQLPPNLVAELKKKRELEKTWKSLVSSNWTEMNVTADQLSISEEAYLRQKEHVKNIFSNFRGVLNEKNLNNRACFWSTVSGKVKQSTEISAVLSESGALKCEPEDVRHEVENHLVKTFLGSLETLSHPKPVFADNTMPMDTDHTYAHDYSSALPKVGNSENIDKNPNNWLARRFTSKEVRTVANTLLNNKACGWDKLPNEFIKYGPDKLFLLLSTLFDKIKDKNEFPTGWNKGRITLVHKRGSRAVLKNYRPITVIISLAGLFSKVLNARLTQVVERHDILGDVQGGFRKGRGGADNVFILHTLLWKAQAKKQQAHLAFLDISKAYDSVNREVLWAKLTKLGITGKFLNMLMTMYSGDSVDCNVNGTTTRCVYLKRGLRQGCSLSPLLFNIYISSIGHDLMTNTDGFLLGDRLPISGLLFADDIILISRSAGGLKRLLNIVHSHCNTLKLDISEEKSKIISPADDSWDLIEGDGGRISLKQVVQYKYLGVETFNTMFKTCTAKQKKCISVAKRYMFACLHLGKLSTDVVRISLATWINIAVPTITFGCENIIFCESNMAELESIEAKVAKRILGVPTNTSNVCAQSELGLKPIRLHIYLQQLKFFFRVLRLSSRRWVKVALIDHLSGSWNSKYISYICRIRKETSLFVEPPSLKYLSVHMHQWAIARTNTLISSHNLPFVTLITSFKKQPYVFAHKFLSVIAAFRLSNAGLGNKCPISGFTVHNSCPLCSSVYKLDEAHILFTCSAVRDIRRDTGISLFLTQSALHGNSMSKSHYLFIAGFDLSGNMVNMETYKQRAAAISALRAAWLNKHGS